MIDVNNHEVIAAGQSCSHQAPGPAQRVPSPRDARTPTPLLDPLPCYWALQAGEMTYCSHSLTPCRALLVRSSRWSSYHSTPNSTPEQHHGHCRADWPRPLTGLSSGRRDRIRPYQSLCAAAAPRRAHPNWPPNPPRHGIHPHRNRWAWFQRAEYPNRHHHTSREEQAS